MAASLFSKRILEQLVLHRHLGVHLLEAAILLSHRLHLRNQRRIHPTVFAPTPSHRICSDSYNTLRC